MKYKWEKYNGDYFLKGSKIAYQNALDHFEAARLLKESKLKGFSINHLVLCSEEFVKALVLICKYLGSPIENASLDAIFSKHDIKHIAAKFLNNTNLYFDFLSKSLIQSLNSNEIRTYDDLKTKLMDGFINKPDDKAFIQISKFWDNIESFRIKGVYVEPQGNNWWKPNEFKPETYNQVYTYVSELLKTMKSIIENPELNTFTF